MRKTATGPFLSVAIRDSDMKEKPGQALQRDHVCYEIGSDQFAIGLLILLENGERCDQCLVAMYFALGPLSHRALVNRQHRATKGEVEELQHKVYDILTDDDYGKLLSYNPARGAFEAWLAAFVNHHLIDRHRKQHGEVSLEEISAAVQSPDPGKEAEYLKAERIEILRRAIAELPVRHQKFLKLWIDDGLSMRDIAQATGYTPQYVRTLKRKLIKHLASVVAGSSKKFSKNDKQRGHILPSQTYIVMNTE